MDFKKQLVQIGKLEKAAKKYFLEIYRTISCWAKEAEAIDESLNDVVDIQQFKKLAGVINRLDIFQVRRFAGSQYKR